MREISIHELDDIGLRAELSHVVGYLRSLGHEQCELRFGWHWAIDYYPTPNWGKEQISLADVEAKVRQVENAGLGWLGGDDVTLNVPGVHCEFYFCHHWGIHLKFSEPDPAAADFLKRWCTAGLSPKEREVVEGS